MTLRHLIRPHGMGLAFLAFSRHQIQFKTEVYSVTMQQLKMSVHQPCMKDQNQHVKDGLGARMYSLQKCRLYESEMSKSRGLPVLCLVTLKSNKCETVTLKSLWGVYSWKPFVALCWHCRWHCCVFYSVTVLTDTCIEHYSQLGENLV